MQPRTRRLIVAIAAFPTLFWALPRPLAGQSWLGGAALGVQVRGAGGALSGARVEVLYRGPGGETGGPAPRATDDQGQASFDGLAEGVWSLEVSHPDHLSYVATVSLRRGRKTEVVSSFLEASGAGRNPMRVRLFQPGNRQLGEPLAVTRAEPAPAPPAEEPQAPPPAAAEAPAAEPAAGEGEAAVTRPAEPVREPRVRPVPTPEPPPVPETPAVPPEPQPAPEARPARPVGPAPGADVRTPDEAAAPAEPAAEAPAEALPELESATPTPSQPPGPDAVSPVPSETAAPESPAAAAPLPGPGPEPAPMPERVPVPPPVPEPEPAAPAAATVPATGEPPASEPPVAPDAPVTQPPPPAETQAAQPPAPPASDQATPPPAPEPEPAPLAPLAGSDASARSFRDRTCFECKPGEWAVGASREVAAGSGCPPGALARAEAGASRLAAAAAETLARYGGDALGTQVLARLDDDSRAALEGDLGPLLATASACRLLVLALPEGARMVGFRFEALDEGEGGVCFGDEPCPIGDSRWLAPPGIERGPGATLLWAVFENRSLARPRIARFVGYFMPPVGWRP